jgi:hypothetical protein
MARPLRIEYAGALYHVTSRGNERKNVFKSQRDRREVSLLCGIGCCAVWSGRAYLVSDGQSLPAVSGSDWTFSYSRSYIPCHQKPLALQPEYKPSMRF